METLILNKKCPKTKSKQVLETNKKSMLQQIIEQAKKEDYKRIIFKKDNTVIYI